MVVDRAMPNEKLASVVHLAELHGRRAVGNHLPARIGCWTRPLPLEGCVTCGWSPVRTRCRRGDPVLCGHCASASQTGRTPADCGSHGSGARSALLVSAIPVASVVPQVRNPSPQGAETRSSSKALQLLSSEVEVPWDPVGRALSGTKQVEVVVVYSVVVLLSTDYPQ